MPTNRGVEMTEKHDSFDRAAGYANWIVDSANLLTKGKTASDDPELNIKIVIASMQLARLEEMIESIDFLATVVQED